MKHLLIFLLAFTVLAATAQTKPAPLKTAPAKTDSVKIGSEDLKKLIELAYNGLDGSPDVSALQARESKKQLAGLYKYYFPEPKAKADTTKKK